MQQFAILIILAGLAGCATSGDVSVMDKVLTDFGLQEAPEGYIQGSDRVFEELDKVGQSEMKRLNGDGRHGEVKFQQDGLRGLYFKEVKVYTNYFPLDARAVSKAGADKDRGYQGYVEYEYRYYESERTQNRAEAEAATASIGTDRGGRESYRYHFTSSGVWNGNEGERTKN
ncbi:MAG: hypothetical protein HYV27_11640 [Candidatus Hydrogenedentes bacterium]|nr:hypothetical protein [Candidatus Hydrogenedentota bacterium]